MKIDNFFSIPSIGGKVLCRREKNFYILFDGYGLEFYKIDKVSVMILYAFSKKMHCDELVEVLFEEYSESIKSEIYDIIYDFFVNLEIKSIDRELLVKNGYILYA